jgi:tetratricopeptide (TPR) repeat protein
MNARPEDIPALEQRVAARPDDADANATLGVAYYNAKRYEDARSTLAKAIAAGSNAGASYLYLGLANEELKDWPAARAAYQKYVEVGADGDVKDQIRGRLALVARQQLKADAKLVLEREQQLTDEPPTPRTVAVMPFNMVGTSEELAPLQTALTDMIITDLSVSPAIISIERVKMNAMIDEMLLAQSGLVESNTGVRVGRLLKAEHVVQGQLAQSGDQQLRADATVLNTVRREAAGTFAQSQALSAIFDLEKQIVFSIFDAVGVTLTASEREKINENRTGNLLAFLAYGRGLNELDRGNYQEASTFFRQASQLDPNFAPAQVQQTEAAELQAAEQTTTAEVAAVADAEVPLPAAAPAVENLAATIAGDLNPSNIDNITQGTTQNTQSSPPSSAGDVAQNQSGNIATSTGQITGPTVPAKATITIIIKRPGA